MEKDDPLYLNAHLVVAGVRIYLHREKREPSIAEVAELTGLARESASYLVERLERLEAIKVVETAFQERVFLIDHIKVELLLDEEEGPAVEDQLEDLEKEKEDRHKTIDQRFSPEFKDKKKEDLFAEIEKRLGGDVKEKANPLDQLFKGKGEKA